MLAVSACTPPQCESSLSNSRLCAHIAIVVVLFAMFIVFVVFHDITLMCVFRFSYYYYNANLPLSQTILAYSLSLDGIWNPGNAFSLAMIT